MPQPHQHWIPVTCATYSAAWSNSESLTHWARPGIKPISSMTFCEDSIYSHPLSHNGNSCLFLFLFYFISFYLFYFILLYFILFYFILCFIGPFLWYMEVPKLGVESELQLLAYTTATATWDPSSICDPYHRSWQCRIPDPLRPGIEPTSSWILVRFISTEPHWELLLVCF